MGGKARWRKLQRVVGCLPLGPRASPDKPRQRRERARTRDAKRRKLGDDGEEENDTILIGQKKEKEKGKEVERQEEHDVCQGKGESSKGNEELNHQKEVEIEEVKTQQNDVDESFIKEHDSPKVMENRAGVWIPSPNGWVFQPMTNTTLEEELKKAQEEEEEEEENEKRDPVLENGQRIAKFFLSDDESDSGTAIFIDVCQPGLPENKDDEPAVVTVDASSSSPKETQPNSLTETSSGLPVESRVHSPPQAENLESVLADAIKEYEPSEGSDPLAKISSMEAVLTDSPRHHSSSDELPRQFFECVSSPDPVDTDQPPESGKSSTNEQLCMSKTDEAVRITPISNTSDYIKPEPADSEASEISIIGEFRGEEDVTCDDVCVKQDTDLPSMPDISRLEDHTCLSRMDAEITKDIISEPLFYDEFREESRNDQDIIDSGGTISRDNIDIGNIFISYPDYHDEHGDSFIEDNESRTTPSGMDDCLYSRNSCETPQESKESECNSTQDEDNKDESSHPENQITCDKADTTSFSFDVPSEASQTIAMDHSSTLFTETGFATTHHHSGDLNNQVHVPESVVELEEARTEAGQDALELENKLEIERSRQSLVGKAREWIRGVARMGSARMGDSSYGKLPVLETAEDNAVFASEKIDVSLAATDMSNDIPIETSADLPSHGEENTHYTPERDQSVCFASTEDVRGKPALYEDQEAQSTHQENLPYSSDKWDSWNYSYLHKDTPEDSSRGKDPKKQFNENANDHTEGTQDLKETKCEANTHGEATETTQDLEEVSTPAKSISEDHPSDNMTYHDTPAYKEDLRTNEDVEEFPTPGEYLEELSKPDEELNEFATPDKDLKELSKPDEVIREFLTPGEGLEEFPIPDKELKEFPTPQEEFEEFPTPDENLKELFNPDEELREFSTPDLKEPSTPEQELKEFPTLDKELKELPTLEEELKEFPTLEEALKESPTLNEDLQEPSTPKEELEEFPTPVSYENDHLTRTTQLRMCVLPSDINVYPSSIDDSRDPTHDEHLLTYSKPATFQNFYMDSELYYTPEEEMSTPYTPAERIKICCSSGELIHSHYTPDRDFRTHDTPAEELEIYHTPENEPRIYDKEDEEINHTCYGDDGDDCDGQFKPLYKPSKSEECYIYYTPASAADQDTNLLGEGSITDTPAYIERNRYTPEKITDIHNTTEAGVEKDEQATLSKPEEDNESSSTPDKELNIYSTPEKIDTYDSYIFEKIEDRFAQKQETHYISEREAKVCHTPEEVKEAYYTYERNTKDYSTPESQGSKDYTPVEHAYIFTVEDREKVCYLPTGKNWPDTTPERQDTNYHTPEEHVHNFTLEDREKVCYLPTEENWHHSTPERQDTNYHTPEERVYNFAVEDKEKAHYPLTEESWPHSTPADKENTCGAPSEGPKRFSTPEEYQETSPTPENELSAYQNTTEEEIINDTPVWMSSLYDEKQNTPAATMNTGYYTPTDNWEPYRTPTESNTTISTPENESTLTFDFIHVNTPTPVKEKNENTYEPLKIPENSSTPDICVPDERATNDTPDTEEVEIHYTPGEDIQIIYTPDQGSNYTREDVETRYIPVSQLVEERMEEEKRVEDDEEKLEDEGTCDEEKGEDDDTRRIEEIEREKRSNEESKKREREEERDSEREGRKVSEKEGRENSERERERDSERERENSERERERDSERERERDGEREEGKDIEREGRNNDEREGRKNSERERERDSERDGRTDSERAEGKDIEKAEGKDIEKAEGKDSEREGRNNSEKEQGGDSEIEGRKSSEREEGSDSERDGRKDRDMEGRKDSEREEDNGSEREGCKNDEREVGKDSEKEGEKDSEREGEKDSEREEGKANEREGDKDGEREEGKDSERGGNKNGEREGRKDNEREEDKNSEREGGKDVEWEGRKDSEREGRRASDWEKIIHRENEGKMDSERERRLSEWEWRRENGEEKEMESGMEKRKNEVQERGSEMKERNESEEEGNCDDQTGTSTTSSSFVQHFASIESESDTTYPLRDVPPANEDQCAAVTHDSLLVDKDSTVPYDKDSTGPQNVTPDDDTIEQEVSCESKFPGKKVRSTRKSKSHQDHSDTRRQEAGAANDDSAAKLLDKDEKSEGTNKEGKTGNRRRRSRKHNPEQQTSSQSHTATGRDQTASQISETKFLITHGETQDTETHQGDSSYQRKENHSRKPRTPCSPRENLEGFDASIIEYKSVGVDTSASGSFKESLGSVSLQEKQHQDNIKDKQLANEARQSGQRNERFSDEQKAGGAGEFAVPESVGKTSGKTSHSSERKRAKGNEKGSRRNKDKDRHITREKHTVGEQLESVGMAATPKVRSPKSEKKKGKKENKKEKKEKKPSEKYENVKEAEIKSPREELSSAAGRGRSGVLQSRPPLLDTPVKEDYQRRGVKSDNRIPRGSLLGPPPLPPEPSCCVGKLKYPEALLQPLSPPPSPPLHNRNGKQKNKTISGHREKVSDSSFTPDAPSYARKASQSLMATIPEAASPTPQQTEQNVSSRTSNTKHFQDRTPSPPESYLLKDASECSSPDPSMTSSAKHSPQDESLETFSVRQLKKLPLESKSNLTELDASRTLLESREEISTSGNHKPGTEDTNSLGSPQKVSVAERIKFLEAVQSAAEAKVDVKKGSSTLCKSELQQASSVLAARPPVKSEEGTGTAASFEPPIPPAKPTFASKVSSKPSTAKEATPQATFPPHMTCSTSSCIDKTETNIFPPYEKPLQKIIPPPRPRRSNAAKSKATECVREGRSDCIYAEERTENQQERGVSCEQEKEVASPRSFHSPTASPPQQQHQLESHALGQEGFVAPKEGHLPRSRDAKTGKKKRRR